MRTITIGIPISLVNKGCTTRRCVCRRPSGADQLSYSKAMRPISAMIPVNAEQQVRSMGATIGLAYYINDKFSLR